jgi:MOSC domain-containing protein YiiM
MKLAMRFERPSMVREFARSGRSGFYCAVIDEGEIAPLDCITWGERSTGMPTVAELFMS